MHSCSQRGLVAAKLNSERPGNVIPLSKNIYCTVSAFIASVTVDVFETGRKRLSALPSCSSPLEQLSSNLVTTTVCIHSVHNGDQCHVPVKTVIQFIVPQNADKMFCSSETIVLPNFGSPQSLQLATCPSRDG